jgi:hypothetical protein
MQDLGELSAELVFRDFIIELLMRVLVVPINVDKDGINHLVREMTARETTQEIDSGLEEYTVETITQLLHQVLELRLLHLQPHLDEEVLDFIQGNIACAWPLRAVHLEHVKHLLDLYHARSVEVARVPRVVRLENAPRVTLERMHKPVHEKSPVTADVVFNFVDDMLAAKHLDGCGKDVELDRLRYIVVHHQERAHDRERNEQHRRKPSRQISPETEDGQGEVDRRQERGRPDYVHRKLRARDAAPEEGLVRVGLAVTIAQLVPPCPLLALPLARIEEFAVAPLVVRQRIVILLVIGSHKRHVYLEHLVARQDHHTQHKHADGKEDSKPHVLVRNHHEKARQDDENHDDAPRLRLYLDNLLEGVRRAFFEVLREAERGVKCMPRHTQLRV